MASKTITKQRSTHYITGLLNNVPMKIIYFKNFEKSFANFLILQGITPYNITQILHFQDILHFYNNFNFPAKIKIWKIFKRYLSCQEEDIGGGSITVNLLNFKNEWYLIKEIKKQEQCEYCGVTYNKIHNCNVKRRDFYYHYINHETKTWWEQIKFSPVGSVKNAKRLFIVYDIETYTYHTAYGKQLVPYLLVFTLLGSSTLKNIAKKIAITCNFVFEKECFLMLDHKEDKIGAAFKLFRSKLQKALAKKIWLTFMSQHNLSEILTFEQLQKLNKEKKLNVMAQPQFIEVYVVGHNICGFDEIVLASHVLEGIKNEDNLSMFKFSRTFMPRAGKLLFNDISLSLPNPKFQKPNEETFKRWNQGIMTEEDFHLQGLKFMVRDTYLLTHCSLRNAAEAYQLPILKGHCPYNALNELFMLGDYEKESSGYPVEKYWSNKTEYEENKPSIGKKYDILGEATKYCIDDVKVTSQLVMQLITGYQDFCEKSLQLSCLFNIFQRPTISSNTQALFKQLFYRNEVFKGEFLTNLEAPSEKMYDYVRSSVRGGRCYPTFVGIYDEPVFVYDICGMYASALTHPMPYGKTLNPFEANLAINHFQHILDSKNIISYFDSSIKPMIVTVDCDPPSLDMLDVLPPLCSKKSGKLCWTNEPLNQEVVTTIDLITLHNRGWRCKILKNQMYAVWPEWKEICREYVKVNITAKEQADKEKNKTKRSISKLLSNALYGSFATKLDQKKVIFANDIDEKDKNRLIEGKSEIISYTSVINKSLPKRTTEQWSKYFLNLPEMNFHQRINKNDFSQTPPFITDTNHVIFKPITYLSADCDELILTTIEDKEEWIKNNRYPTQIASFVLAWTRAFMSEWSEILYGEDRGKPYSERILKSLYGDTDSLFLTAEGHKLMLSKGKYRLKQNNRKLIFDSQKPELTWVVECETKCPKCDQDSFASESCFLAPKLYALKDITCSQCQMQFEGKLRAKGHAKDCLNYEILKECFTEYYLLEQPKKEFATQRKSLKRTLQTGNEVSKPFTVVEKHLLRILRPWKDITLFKGTQFKNGYLLYPYDRKHPNPRPQELLTENPFWGDF
ncbi:DNA pol [Odocoileus adenovirus 1]|uniref:DNA polymerase n=2 Tax=Deer atadenovirus A TaxID=2169706 RepID=A0A223PYR5_9ADEN|nr:DNA pol [Odocoileus adenovirus 1]QEM20933.1 DNA pol [Deer atadenovirus A]ASU50470.1 DNA pol [Odocoileus adenovirus 1]ASU50497.1 DNA pol [Odocoileus adenovirus 1]ASU50635.1 DNA pol [Odocoileus adenovirus 1]UNU90943.1 DNA pol [Deer atadenovirus A]